MHEPATGASWLVPAAVSLQAHLVPARTRRRALLHCPPSLPPCCSDAIWESIPDRTFQPGGEQTITASWDQEGFEAGPATPGTGGPRCNIQVRPTDGLLGGYSLADATLLVACCRLGTAAALARCRGFWSRAFCCTEPAQLQQSAKGSLPPAAAAAYSRA